MTKKLFKILLLLAFFCDAALALELQPNGDLESLQGTLSLHAKTGIITCKNKTRTVFDIASFFKMPDNKPSLSPSSLIKNSRTYDKAEGKVSYNGVFPNNENLRFDMSYKIAQDNNVDFSMFFSGQTKNQGINSYTVITVPKLSTVAEVKADGLPLPFDTKLTNTTMRGILTKKIKSMEVSFKDITEPLIFNFNDNKTRIVKIRNVKSKDYYQMEICLTDPCDNNEKTSWSVEFSDPIEEAAVIDKDNVYSGVDFNINKFTVPDYNLSRNLLQNPSFENGFDYWDYGYSGSMTRVAEEKPYEIVSAQAWHGKHSLKIYRKVDIRSAPVSFAIPVEMNDDYMLSFYAKSKEPDTLLYVWGINEKRENNVVSAKSKLTTSWKRYSYPVKPVSGKLVSFTFLPWSDGTIWLDAIQFEKTSKVSEFTSTPVTLTVNTDRRENLFQPDEKANAYLKVASFSEPQSGSINVKVKDFFGKQIYEDQFQFNSSASEPSKIPMAFFDKNLRGVFVIESNIKTLKGFEKTYFNRIYKVPFLNNTHKHKNLFSGSISGSLRFPDPKRQYRLWKKIGIGSAVIFKAPNFDAKRILDENNILFFPSIEDVLMERPKLIKLRRGQLFLGKYDLRSRHPEALPIEQITPEEYKFIEEAAYNHAKKYSDVKIWKTINEPVNRPADNEKMKEFIKVNATLIKGLKRAIPDAVVLTPDLANINQAMPWLDSYFRNGGAKYHNAVAVHHYRGYPENPNLDEDLDKFIKMVDKYMPGSDIWITEGGYYFTYHFPEFGINMFSNKCNGGDHNDVYDLSYDLGIGEKLGTAYTMRTYLMCLKYGDRIKSASDWSTLANRLEFGFDMVPKTMIFAYNTLGNLLGSSRYIKDIPMANDITCYLFEEKGDPVIVIWNSSRDIASGKKEAPMLNLSNIKTNYEILDITGNQVEIPKDSKIEIDQYPVFVRGTKGNTEDLAEQFYNCSLTGASLKKIRVSAKLTSENTVTITVKNIFQKNLETMLTIKNKDKVVFRKRVDLKVNEEKNIPFRVRAASSQKNTFDIAYSCKLLNGEDITDEISLNYYKCPHVNENIKIDGNMAKWKNSDAIDLSEILNIKLYGNDIRKFKTPIPWYGKDDLSGKMWLGWNKKGLYFAAAIKDDNYSPTGNVETAWSKDSIQIYFDSFADAGVSKDDGYDSNDQSYDISFPDKRILRRLAAEYQLSFLREEVVRAAKMSFKKTQAGYDLELMIPFKELRPLTIQPGAAFGFSPLVNDNDGDYRKRGLTLIPGNFEPNRNPQKYPQFIFTK